jgi:hypothetical protein
MQGVSRRLKALDTIDPDTAADPIPEFCRQHRLSVALYYKLPKEQRPREIQIGRKKPITREAAAEWRHRMEAQTADGGA